MTENEIGNVIIASAMKVHGAVGPGLLESAYETCLLSELDQQVAIPICYEDLRIDNGYRVDLLVADRVVVELKAVEAILPVHRGSSFTTGRLQAQLPVEFPCRTDARRHRPNGQWPLILRVLCEASASSAVKC